MPAELAARGREAADQQLVVAPRRVGVPAAADVARVFDPLDSLGIRGTSVTRGTVRLGPLSRGLRSLVAAAATRCSSSGRALCGAHLRLGGDAAAVLPVEVLLPLDHPPALLADE